MVEEILERPDREILTCAIRFRTQESFIEDTPKTYIIAEVPVTVTAIESGRRVSTKQALATVTLRPASELRFRCMQLRRIVVSVGCHWHCMRSGRGAPGTQGID